MFGLHHFSQECVMMTKNFWIAGLVGGVVVNALDFAIMGNVLQNMYFVNMSIMNQTTNPIWYVIGDFLAAFVFTWFYHKVYSSFEGGMQGGMKFGIYAGVLINFPAMIFMHLMFKDYPYALSWIMTFYGIIWSSILGAVVGKFYVKGASAA